MDRMSVVRKKDLIAAVAKQNGLSLAKACEAVDALLDAIMQGTRKGPVTLFDFGAFRCQHRRARKGRNPRTGETIDIPSSTFPVFVPGKRLKEMLNAGKRRKKRERITD